MATQVQNRRGTTAEHSTFTGANGELTVDTTKRTLVVHDGATAGGRPLLREDQSNLPTSAPTTGIYNASGSLAVSTNGTKRIEIQADGDIDIDNGGVFYDATNNRLAIGTTSPSEKLTVDGSLAITWGSGRRAGMFYDNSFRQGLAFDDSNRQLKLFSTANDSGGTIAFYTRLAEGSSDTDYGTERARIDSSGRLLVGTSSDSGGALLQVNGDRIRVGTAKTPASATATGTAGEICWDASYVYVCTATNTWKRSALSTW